MANDFEKGSTLNMTVPVLKKEGWNSHIDYSVTASSGITINSVTPTGTDGDSNSTFSVVATVTQFAALGANWIKLSGTPPPKEVKTVNFNVIASNAQVGWYYDGWSEVVPTTVAPTTPIPTTATPTTTQPVSQNYAFSIRFSVRDGTYRSGSYEAKLSISGGQIAEYTSGSPTFKSTTTLFLNDINSGISSYDAFISSGVFGSSKTLNIQVTDTNKNKTLSTTKNYTIPLDALVIYQPDKPQLFVDIHCSDTEMVSLTTMGS